MTELAKQHCLTPEQGLQRLTAPEAAGLLKQLNDWEHDAEARTLRRTFRFKDFYQTIAFVNAIAWIANQQDHHPDLAVGYNRCVVSYTTHAVNGLSLNDFICAARIDTLDR